MALVRQTQFSRPPVAGSGARLGQLISGAVQSRRAQQRGEEFERLLGMQEEGGITSDTQRLAQAAVTDPARFDRVSKSLGLINQQQKNEMADWALQTQMTPFDQREQAIRKKVTELQARGEDSSQVAGLLNMTEAQQDQAFDAVQLIAMSPVNRRQILRGGRAQFGAQKTFKDEKGNIYFGTLVGDPSTGTARTTLAPVGDAPETPVGSVQLVTDIGLTAAEKVTQKGREVTAQQQAKISAGRVKEMSEQIPKIQTSIGNINEAISALDRGAQTGVVTQYMPNIRAASVELDNIRKRMGLDVIGSVTFGALSESEMNMALSTAMPAGLKPEELRNWLDRKRSAQQKALAALQEAMLFLSQPGNTVADWHARTGVTGEQMERTEPVTQPTGQIKIRGIR